MVGNIIESTFLLVMAYLILMHADAFSSAARAVGSVYTNAVQTLQGR